MFLSEIYILTIIFTDKTDQNGNNKNRTTVLVIDTIQKSNTKNVYPKYKIRVKSFKLMELETH